MTGYTLKPPLSRSGLAFVAAAHGVLLFALLQMNVVRLPAPLAGLTVHFIKPPEEIKPPEPPSALKPRPIEKRPVPQPVRQPVPLAAPEASPAPSPALVAPPPPEIVAPPPPIQAPPAPPAPMEVVKPRFDADYLDNPKPMYPALSRRMGEEGKVVLRVQVAASGLPTEVVLHVSSGSARLDQAAIDAVRRWKFLPARRGDQAVAASVLVPIVFSLKE